MIEQKYVPPQQNKMFKPLTSIVITGALLTAVGILYPKIFMVLINFFWIMMLIIVAVFLILGVLVLVGMKDEVGQFLEVLLEGSLTILDAFNFIKRIYQKFIQVLKDFIYLITPIIAVWLSLIIYIALLILYKSVGMSGDVTILTIILTVTMVVAVGVLNQNKKMANDESWSTMVRARFKTYFADSFEVVIFIFFLTMDQTNLFFLPDKLNVPLQANIGSYDLMLRGTNYSEQLLVTIYLVTISIFLEILRNVIRILAIAVGYYKEFPKEDSRIINIKESLRLSFADSKDDLLRFITFTTFLVLVFLLFPRLKLFAMFIATATGIVLDLLLKDRLTHKKENDLISRILNKIFKV